MMLPSRRRMLSNLGSGVGMVGLAGVMADAGLAGAAPSVPENPLAPRAPHFAPKAKHVIYLFQNGAPTHVDLYDYKPKIKELHGQPVPDSFFQGKRFSTMTGDPTGKLMLSPVEPFTQHGESGAWVSNFLPHISSVVDELCFVKSMHTEAVNHAPAISFLLSGAELPGRPSLGAWLTYGLGSETEELPGFVVMTSISKGTSCGQIFYDFYWGSGFIPSKFQGVKFRGGGDPVVLHDGRAVVQRRVNGEQIEQQIGRKLGIKGDAGVEEILRAQVAAQIHHDQAATAQNPAQIRPIIHISAAICIQKHHIHAAVSGFTQVGRGVLTKQFHLVLQGKFLQMLGSLLLFGRQNVQTGDPAIPVAQG